MLTRKSRKKSEILVKQKKIFKKRYFPTTFFSPEQEIRNLDDEAFKSFSFEKDCSPIGERWKDLAGNFLLLKLLKIALKISLKNA